MTSSHFQGDRRASVVSDQQLPLNVRLLALVELVDGAFEYINESFKNAVTHLEKENETIVKEIVEGYVRVSSELKREVERRRILNSVELELELSRKFEEKINKLSLPSVTNSGQQELLNALVNCYVQLLSLKVILTSCIHADFHQVPQINHRLVTWELRAREETQPSVTLQKQAVELAKRLDQVAQTLALDYRHKLNTLEISLALQHEQSLAFVGEERAHINEGVLTLKQEIAKHNKFVKEGYSRLRGAREARRKSVNALVKELVKKQQILAKVNAGNVVSSLGLLEEDLLALCAAHQKVLQICVEAELAANKEFVLEAEQLNGVVAKVAEDRAALIARIENNKADGLVEVTLPEGGVLSEEEVFKEYVSFIILLGAQLNKEKQVLADHHEFKSSIEVFSAVSVLDMAGSVVLLDANQCTSIQATLEQCKNTILALAFKQSAWLQFFGLKVTDSANFWFEVKKGIDKNLTSVGDEFSKIVTEFNFSEDNFKLYCQSEVAKLEKYFKHWHERAIVLASEHKQRISHGYFVKKKLVADGEKNKNQIEVQSKAELEQLKVATKKNIQQFQQKLAQQYDQQVSHIQQDSRSILPMIETMHAEMPVMAAEWQQAQQLLQKTHESVMQLAIEQYEKLVVQVKSMEAEFDFVAKSLGVKYDVISVKQVLMQSFVAEQAANPSWSVAQKIRALLSYQVKLSILDKQLKEARDKFIQVMCSDVAAIIWSLKKNAGSSEMSEDWKLKTKALCDDYAHTFAKGAKSVPDGLMSLRHYMDRCQKMLRERQLQALAHKAALPVTSSGRGGQAFFVGGMFGGMLGLAAAVTLAAVLALPTFGMSTLVVGGVLGAVGVLSGFGMGGLAGFCVKTLAEAPAGMANQPSNSTQATVAHTLKKSRKGQAPTRVINLDGGQLPPKKPVEIVAGVNKKNLTISSDVVKAALRKTMMGTTKSMFDKKPVAMKVLRQSMPVTMVR